MKTEAEVRKAIESVCFRAECFRAEHDNREIMSLMLLATASALRWVLGGEKEFQRVLDQSDDKRKRKRSAAVN